MGRRVTRYVCFWGSTACSSVVDLRKSNVQSVMVSGFPNYIATMGPQAPVASNSIHLFIEQQVGFFASLTSNKTS
jgi:hypothetical protein